MAKITLEDGKQVEISNVLFNKEQKINVPKTYITTVKKAVTKVGNDFYKVRKDLSAKTVQKEIEVNVNEVPSLEMTMPELTLEPTPVENTENVVSDVNPELEIPAALEVDSLKNDNIENIASASVENTLEKEPVNISTELETPKTLEVDSVKSGEQTQVLEEKLAPAEVTPEPVKVEPINTDFLPPADLLKEEDKKEIAPIEEAKVEEQSVIPSASLEEDKTVVIPSVLPQTPVNENADASTQVETQPISEEPKLLFDASNESNLNKALGEVSNEKIVNTSQTGVESLREFGVDEQLTSAPEALAEENVKKLTRSKGFANNKFFMVVAIAFFLAACVFLGYEAFQYFQLAK